MTSHTALQTRPRHLPGVKPVPECSDRPTVTRVWERFRALPAKLQILVWTGFAAMVVVGVAVPASPSNRGGGPSTVTAHGLAAPTTTSTDTTATTAPSPATGPATGPSPSPSKTTITAPPKTTTTTAAPSAPTAPSAESELAELRLAPEGPRTGYDRSLFPQWIDADHDGCDTRHEVLITESVVPAHEGANCAVTGEWYSAYDGVTTTDASKFDIDHVVPLAEAWDSGASTWDAARRTAYANDLDHRQTLRAVTASANRSKGDDDPAAWKPPLQSDWCSYATDWVSIKVTWNLTADPAEVDALRGMLATCIGAGPTPAPVPPPTSTSTTTTAAPGNGGAAAGMTVSNLDCGGEAVTVTDGGPAPADLTGWTIHDQGTNFTYRFAGGFTLHPGASATVRSGGPAGPGELAWTTRPVWNNDGDTAYLVDAGGTVVSTRRC